MPVTNTWVPILSQFFVAVEQSAGMSFPSNEQASSPEVGQQPPAQKTDVQPKQLPKGVVLDKDGKPCRSCTSLASWMAMAKGKTTTSQLPGTAGQTEVQANAAAAQFAVTLPEDCPADVEVLGRSTWTMLHTMAATYPSKATMTQQLQTKSFISLFSNMYPCSHCAEDFRDWMKQPGNGPRVESRDEFGRWMCEAHNAVNEKLGKQRFDCGKWEERWRDGPPDGRCG